MINVASRSVRPGPLVLVGSMLLGGMQTAAAQPRSPEPRLQAQAPARADKGPRQDGYPGRGHHDVRGIDRVFILGLAAGLFSRLQPPVLYELSGPDPITTVGVNDASHQSIYFRPSIGCYEPIPQQVPVPGGVYAIVECPPIVPGNRIPGGYPLYALPPSYGP